jgi:molybdate transport system substrate-binding protein
MLRVPTQLVLALLSLWPFCLPAQTVRVAAASDLQFAMPELAARYEKEDGAKIELSFGSSGNFFAQIQNGAPFALFFSADRSYAEKLIAAGQADPKSLYVYALGRLVLWAPSDANLKLTEKGLSALTDPRVQKIAIANPQHAPYGRAAVAALKNAGLYERLKPKLVFGENISQAAQFAQSGNAQVGVIALSLALSETMKNGERWIVPADLHPPLEQAAVLLSAGRNKSPAEGFLEFVKSESGRAVLARYGFTAPAPPSSDTGRKP